MPLWITPLLCPVWCIASACSFSRSTSVAPGLRWSSVIAVASPTIPPPTTQKSYVIARSVATEQEGRAGTLANRSDLLRERVGNRNSVAGTLGAREQLRLARDEHGLVGVRRLCRVQHVDHVVQVALELPLVAKSSRIERHQEVSDLVGVAAALSALADRGEGAAGEGGREDLHHHAQPVALVAGHLGGSAECGDPPGVAHRDEVHRESGIGDRLAVLVEHPAGRDG